jgi:hypothetical protein
MDLSQRISSSLTHCWRREGVTAAQNAKIRVYINSSPDPEEVYRCILSSHQNATFPEREREREREEKKS